jgi:hypothetical protein
MFALIWSQSVRKALGGAVAAIVLVAAASRPAPAAEVDYGVYIVSIQGKEVGFEHFVFDVYRDTIVVESGVRQLMTTRNGPDSLRKRIKMMVTTFDMALLNYQSNETLAGKLRTRGLVMADTQYTAYWEVDGVGEGLVYERPPGRLYVHDPEVYVLFDVISRDLSEKEFSSRPISLLVLGARDTTIEVRVTRLPPERIRWGHKPVEAKKLSLHDGFQELLLWSDQAGRLLRLEKPATGLRVERKPPPVKARSPGSG